MFSQFTFAAAIIPSLFLVWYISKADKYPEPTHMLWKTFLGGIIIVAPVLAIALPFNYAIENSPLVQFPIAHGFASAFLTAAIPEEVIKFLVIALFCAKSVDFDEPMDGIVYGAVASLGFATFENVLYVLGGGLPLAIARGLTAVPAHASFGVVMGYFYARAHFSDKKIPLFLAAYFIPTLLHGLYDAFIFAPTNIAAQYTDIDMPAHESILILIFIASFLLTFGTSLFLAFRYLKIMQKEQETM